MIELPQLSFQMVTFTAIIAIMLTNLWWRRRQRSSSLDHTRMDEEPPGDWQQVGQVSGLTIFPLKSAKGIPLQRAEFSSLGLVDVSNTHIQLSDREFIVYDEDKKTAVTGLVKPSIVLMEVTPESESSIKFSFPGQLDFHLQLPVATNQVVLLKRWWGEVVSTVDCGEGLARWVSECLLHTTTGLRVGHFSQPTVPLRTVTNGWSQFTKVYPRLRSQYLGAYSYMASYLLICEESMAELNSHLSRPTRKEQFRANITVKGSPAFAEDSWDWIRFGEQVVLRNFKPCTRCAVTAIDLDTGRLDPELEPLRTLKKFRQLASPEERALSGSEPRFGLYAGMHRGGSVSLGDPVYIGVR